METSSIVGIVGATGARGGGGSGAGNTTGLGGGGGSATGSPGSAPQVLAFYFVVVMGFWLFLCRGMPGNQYAQHVGTFSSLTCTVYDCICILRCTQQVVLVMFFCVFALSMPYSRLIMCGRNSSRDCNANSMPPSLIRAGFRSPTSWSTLLRRHSVACWSMITTTGARASCGWWSWRATGTFRAVIHLALFAKAVGVSSGKNGACGALSLTMGHAASPASCTNTPRVQRATRASRRHDSF